MAEISPEQALAQWVNLIQGGAPTSEIRAFVKENAGVLNDLPVGAFGEVAGGQGIGSELSQEQRDQMVDLQQNVVAKVDPGQGILGQTALLGGGAPLRAVAGATVTKGVPALGSALANAFRFAGRHKGLTAGTVLGGSLLAGPAFFGGVQQSGAGSQGLQGLQPRRAGDASRPTISTDFGRPNVQRTDPQVPTGPGVPVDEGFNIMVVDHSGQLTGTPGAVAIVSSAEMGLGPDPELQSLISDTLATNGGDDSLSFLADFLQQTNAQALAGSQREIAQVLFPESLGSVTIGSPVQVQPSTGSRLPDNPILPKLTGDPQTDARIRKENIEDEQNNPQIESVGVPAGAQLAPRVFDQYNGRTLMEWASIASQRNGIPLSILYGVIDHESGWLTSAVGDNGTSFGLAQIHLPAWGNISQSQALNPAFALEWTAQKLRQRFNQYGRWDAAVAAHNSPAAANHLAKTGKFFNDKSANYVNDVLGRANRSGLASYLFEEGEDLPGVTGTGPSFTPFQEPDPAQSREYITEVYDQLLKREPTEDELVTGVDKILQLSRSAYSANLKQAKGGESQEVDVGAQFQEGIKATGEFDFREETIEQRNFTDYAAGIARLLQQGL